MYNSARFCHKIGPANVYNYYNCVTNQFPGIEGVTAYGIVNSWIRSVISTNTPSSIVVSRLQLTPFTLPSIHDYIVKYVPTNPFQYGNCGGIFIMEHGVNVIGEVAKIHNAFQVDSIIPIISKTIMDLIKTPGMKTIGKITRTPLDHFSENRTNYVYKISDLILDPENYRYY